MLFPAREAHLAREGLQRAQRHLDALLQVIGGRFGRKSRMVQPGGMIKVVDAPFGKRPFRIHIDPTQDGAEGAFAVIDRVWTEMLHRVRLDELLAPARND